jgi:cell division septation protein DedD
MPIQQQPFHPMVAGGNYMPPPPSYPPQSSGVPKNSQNGKPITAIGNLSLFAIVTSLIFMGGFTFLGGFLLGVWLEGPQTRTYGAINGDVSTQQPKLTKTSGPSQRSEASDSDQDGQAEKLTDAAGESAKKVVEGIPLPDMPDFLTPLVSATQDAAKHQASDRAQKAAKRLQKPSTFQRKDSAPVEAQKPLTEQPFYPSSPPLPVTTPVQAPVQSSLLLAPSSQPVSQNEHGEYTIQLGTYAARDNAERLKNHLQGLNYTTYVVEGKSTEGNTLYHVYAGNYKDYSTALSAISQFTSQNIPGAVIVKISQKGKVSHE